jgi:hypothetical protein
MMDTPKVAMPLDIASLDVGDTVELRGGDRAEVIDLGTRGSGVWLLTPFYRVFVDEDGISRVMWKRPEIVTQLEEMHREHIQPPSEWEPGLAV